MGDTEDIKDKRIRELEDEIARLKGEIVVTEEEFRGHPVLRFSGAFKPFSLGLSKCRVILQSLDKVRAFAEKYKQNIV